MPLPSEAPIAGCVAEGYGLQVTALTRVRRGQATRNWLLATPDGRYFVKQYPPGADLAAERTALALAEHARRAGIPTPQVLPTRSGDLLCTSGELAVSLFAHVPHLPAPGSLSPRQMAQAGAVLGRIHRLFHTVDFHRPAETPAWLQFDAEAKQNEVESYLRAIEAKATPDDFDRATRPLLEQRLVLLPEVPRLLGALPPLTTQVIHGDYSPPNLLFAGDTLAAVVDFQPADPFLIAYEIARIALNPENVCARGWIEKSRVLVEAYCRANGVPPDDIRYAPSVWLAQLIRSTYGVREHYTGPLELQRELDAYWFRRANAAAGLLERLEELQDIFAGAWQKAGRT